MAKDEGGHGSEARGANPQAKNRAFKPINVSTIDPMTMHGSAITKEQGQLEKHSSRMNEHFINIGRGYEKPSETRTKSDELSRHWGAVVDRQGALRGEVASRAGPGYYTLPYGVGKKPRK